MKPQKKLDVVTLEYWSCRIDEHRHKSELAAANCIKVRKNNQPKNQARDQFFRKSKMIRLLCEGLSVKECAEIFGISGGRIRKIIETMTRKYRYLNNNNSMGCNYQALKDNPEKMLEFLSKLEECFMEHPENSKAAYNAFESKYTTGEKS